MLSTLILKVEFQIYANIDCLKNTYEKFDFVYCNKKVKYRLVRYC